MKIIHKLKVILIIMMTMIIIGINVISVTIIFIYNKYLPLRLWWACDGRSLQLYLLVI